jgi:hypothetical protein
MTVLQPAAGAFSSSSSLSLVVLAAGFAAAPFAAAVFGCAAHTPLIVITAAVAGTDADISAGGFASLSA